MVPGSGSKKNPPPRQKQTKMGTHSLRVFGGKRYRGVQVWEVRKKKTKHLKTIKRTKKMTIIIWGRWQPLERDNL